MNPTEELNALLARFEMTREELDRLDNLPVEHARAEAETRDIEVPIGTLVLMLCFRSVEHGTMEMVEDPTDPANPIFQLKESPG